MTSTNTQLVQREREDAQFILQAPAAIGGNASLEPLELLKRHTTTRKPVMNSLDVEGSILKPAALTDSRYLQAADGDHLLES